MRSKYKLFPFLYTNILKNNKKKENENLDNKKNEDIIENSDDNNFAKFKTIKRKKVISYFLDKNSVKVFNGLNYYLLNLKLNMIIN